MNVLPTLTPVVLLTVICLGVVCGHEQASREQAYENLDAVKRGGGRGFSEAFHQVLEEPLLANKRLTAFRTPSGFEEKRGGARGFSAGEQEYHSAERRAGGRAFMMPATGNDLSFPSKRAGGRPFYGIADWKRAGGRLFHFYDSPMAKRAGGRGFRNLDDLLEKRAGGRAFGAAFYGGGSPFYLKRAGSRPFHAIEDWPLY